MVMEIVSPAKINFFLYVTGKRPDGYHLLYTLMCRLKFSDTLKLMFTGDRITVNCDHPDVPCDEGNIVWKAATLFLRTFGRKEGLHVDIEKKIPVGAGLGGGSSNAAAVFLGLNQHYGRPFSKERLMEMGLTIGADIPFFIFEKNAIAEGVGEKLKVCSAVSPAYVLIIYPGINVSTGEVYKKLNFGLTKHQKKNNNHFFCLSKGHFVDTKHLWNDLEQVTIKMYPEIGCLKNLMVENGADGALMSGSGSTVFGLFSDKSKASEAYTKIHLSDMACQNNWQVVLTEIMI